jgi:predicted lactoylglutathione lyase
MKKKLGAFSLSLAVKNLKNSRAFYEKLGFTKFGDHEYESSIILRNGETVIGLFQDMFPTNTLTFNPGWDNNAQNLSEFEDIREIQADLKSKGIEFAAEVDETSQGPAHCMIFDPDGNPILIDQHR